jgi:hypothetical protein
VLELLAGLELGAAPADRLLLDAIDTTSRGVRSKLLDDVAVEALPKAWRAWVLEDGRVRRVRYELGCGSLSATPCAPAAFTDPRRQQ